MADHIIPEWHLRGIYAEQGGEPGSEGYAIRVLEFDRFIASVKAEALRDECHTMDELYEYRMLYNALAANAMPELACKSWRHSDGDLCFGGGWFVVYLTLPTGQVSNHYKAEHWDLFQVPAVELAPPYDGHTPQDAAQRLLDYLEAANG